MELNAKQIEELRKYKEHYDKVKNREHRYQIKVKLLLEKAKKAGITVTDAEIDAEMKKK